ncbi:hypothetical protein OG352_26755 [Streptomyces sp. NBC_01485]|uniref:hypothetical protein n=1 Tax=Streptomyces sp. NBC_01485 TaxID=2903884 RepID=UPI002E36EB72|nr:hypothetical protein [Streptomyces sp. NBC_01485]
MTPHPGTNTGTDTETAVAELRAALAANGITLPSLGVDLPTFASTYYAQPLVALGNCNAAAARALTVVLRKAADR